MKKETGKGRGEEKSGGGGGGGSPTKTLHGDRGWFSFCHLQNVGRCGGEKKKTRNTILETVKAKGGGGHWGLACKDSSLERKKRASRGTPKDNSERWGNSGRTTTMVARALLLGGGCERCAVGRANVKCLS